MHFVPFNLYTLSESWLGSTCIDEDDPRAVCCSDADDSLTCDRTCHCRDFVSFSHCVEQSGHFVCVCIDGYSQEGNFNCTLRK